MARACGSYPQCQQFDSVRRYHFGPLVKRLRHRPFTAVTRVQFSQGSPLFSDAACDLKTTLCGRLAQLGEHLPYKQGVIGSSPIATTIFFI
jgi:hypothetical protein